MATSTPSHAAKHAFLYLLSFATLGMVAVNLGIILFQIINYYFPEELYGYGFDFTSEALKFAIATIIVAAPVYFFVTRRINRHLSKKDLDQDSGVRRWLTYIVMFLAAGVVIGDLIAAIFSFLNGELTGRFLLKALVILLIAGGVFLYYFTDMKNESQQSRNDKNNRWAAAFWAVVLIPFVWSFFLVESPGQTRLKRIDQQTVNTLSQVRSAVEGFYYQENRLPENISEITTPQYYLPDLSDVQEKNFEYIVVDAENYQLCADFEIEYTPSGGDRINGYYYDQQWDHPAGHHCFDLQAPPSPTQ